MKTTVEKLENNMVKVDIEIDAETAEKEYNKACKRLAQRVNIPGFRKGKAPKAILEKISVLKLLSTMLWILFYPQLLLRRLKKTI